MQKEEQDEMYCRNRIYSEEYQDFIFQLERPVDHELVDSARYCAKQLDFGFGILHATLGGEAALDIETYTYMAIPKLYGLMDTSALEVSGAIRLQNQTGLQLTGKGVLIGLVDTGIDIFSEAFQKKNGSTRIFRIWDQTDERGSVPDFGYGKEYTKQDIDTILERKRGGETLVASEDFPNDDIGHGSYMAALAAGSESRDGSFIGAAPDCEIMMVKLKKAKQNLRDFYFIRKDAIAYQETDIMMGIQYLYDQAIKAGRPLVILIGVGTNQGDHSGNGALGRYAGFMSNQPKTAIVCAGGNEGNKRHHFYGQIITGQPDIVSEINVGENERGFTLELWGDPPDIFTMTITSPYGEKTQTTRPGIIRSERLRFLLEDTIIYVTYHIAEMQTGKQLIIARFEKPTPGIWKIEVGGANLTSGIFHMWLPIEAFVGEDTYFLVSSPDVTLTEPSNAIELLTNSGYDHYTGAFYLESGRGYNRIGFIKPDLASPSYRLFVPKMSKTAVQAEGYTTFSGTSGGAAILGGVCAQLMEWGVVKGRLPQMKTVDIKNYLIRGADRKEGTAYPNREWGYGTLNGFGAFAVLL